MTRLDNDMISRKALLEDVRNNYEGVEYWRIIERIANAPTIEADSGEVVGYITHWDSEKYHAKIDGNVRTGDKLYTSPQKREWVDLTDKEAMDLWCELHPDSDQRSKKDYWLAIQAKLKEVNHG